MFYSQAFISICNGFEGGTQQSIPCDWGGVSGEYGPVLEVQKEKYQHDQLWDNTALCTGSSQ